MSGEIKTAGIFAGAKIAEASLEATVIRADGRIERLGVVSYYSKNPLKRLAWRLGCFLKGQS